LLIIKISGGLTVFSDLKANPNPNHIPNPLLVVVGGQTSLRHSVRY